LAAPLYLTALSATTALIQLPFLSGTGRALCRLPTGTPKPGQRKETDMENLTYEVYLADPTVRERLEREAHQMRAEAFQQYMVAPLSKLFRRVFKRDKSMLALNATDIHFERIRKTAPDSGATRLKRGSTLKLERGRGTVVRVVDGNVWLTQHHDTADYMMGAGDHMVLNGAGITLIHACEDASLRFVTPGSGWNPSRIDVQWKHRTAVPA
jgi:hypothetical protein